MFITINNTVMYMSVVILYKGNYTISSKLMKRNYMRERERERERGGREGEREREREREREGENYYRKNLI